MAYPIDTAQEMIGQLYVGYFGRAADPVGLDYWVTQLNGGMSLVAIANSFAVQPEATALYSYLAAPTVGDPVAFITAIYQDLFNRGPDAAGLAYWVNQLTVQGTPPGQMVLNIISGAQGSDKTTIENKTHVAVDYAQKFVDNNVTWIGIDNIQGARDVVTPVDNTQASVDAAILQIDGIINQELTNPQNIQLTPNFTSIVSGGTVDITVQADPSQANKSFQFNITGIDSSEVKGGALSGTVTLGTDSKAVIHLDTVVTAESLNTANDTIKVSVPGTVQTLFTNVTLTHGVQTVSQPGPVTEGNAFSFTVSTTGIAAGSANGLVQTYTITGPGLAHIPVAERSGTVTLDANGTATVTVNTLATLADVGTTTVTVAVGNDAPVDVVINETAVQTVTASAGTIPEGGSVVFTIKTTGVAGSAVAGQVENWTLSGAASDQINGPLSGTITLDENGTATVTVSTLVNELNGVPLRDLVFTVLSGAVPTASTTIDVSQGTQVTTNTGPVNEGSAFSFTVTTSGVAPGSVEGRIESYTLSGAGIDHIPVAERSGTVVLDANGHAAVTVHTLADLGPLGPDPVTIQVGNNAPITVNIEDTAFQTVTVDATSINQGQSVTFTVNTFGVPAGALAGTQQTWTLSGTGTNQVTGGVLSGVVTLDANNSAVVTVGTDFSIINGPLTQNLVFNLDSGGSTVSSPTVTIHESTLTVTPPALPIVEGNQVTYTITGTNIPNGTTFTYTLSGDAIGNVVPASQINGTVTINNNNATVVINTLSNDPSGLTKGLTLTIDQVPTATGTALIAETAPLSFILTTGTDNFVGNPAGENTFFAVANSNFFAPSSTLGQNDNLNGGSAIAGRPNTLFLQTTGLLPQLINAFTTTDIQVFSINAGQDGDGTTIDMSSVFGLQKVVNANSSGHLTLLNVTSEIDLELLHPSDILGKNVDLIVQYQNNPAKPATQTLTLDPTVSPLTALPIARFWVNVPQVTITSAGPPINGLMSINGAAGPFAATALTTLTMLGGTDFIAGVDGSGQVATAFTGAEVGAAGNLLDLAAFGGIYFNVGDPGDFAGITSVGGLTIRSGPGGIQGIYVPGPGATGAVQVGGGIAVGGNLALNIGDGKISDQSMTIGGSLTALGNPFGAAAGGLLTSTVTTLGGSQTYDGFNGGLSGMLVTNGGSLNIGSPGRVNGTIDVAISTGTGAAVVFGGDGDVTLDFSGAGTTGFHRALAGPGSTDRFYGGSGVNTLIFDPMINNVNGGPNGMGQATGVQNIVLQSPAGTPWDGTAGGAPGNLPTNTVDLGRLNLNAALTGPNPGFPQTIRIDGPLGPTGQTFMGAVSNDVFVLDNNGTAVKGGSMQGQVMAFDFIQATASNAMSLVVDNVNQQDGAPALVLRDFDALSAEAADQDPITTLNLTLNRNAGFPQVSETITLDNLNRLTTLELAGTANNFDDDQGATGLFIDPVGGGGTLTTITGGNANVNIAFLAFDYLSKQGGSIVLGNGANTIGAFAGDWEITFGKVPGGGTAEDSGNSLVYLIPDLGSRHTVRAGGGHDTFVIGRIFASPLQPDGGVVDITAGPGEDWFVFDQSGPFPSITSAQKLDGGVDRDRILLVDGALNENDSLFGQVTSVEELQLAVGKFDNSLLLNFFANQSGLDTIFTTGGGSSNVFFEGTGFTNAVTYRIATGDTGGDAVIVAALPTGSNAITVRSSVTGFDTAFESGLLTKAINPGTGLETPSGIFANPFAANTLELVADGTTANVFGNGTFGVHDVQRIVGVSGGSSAAQTVWLVNDPALFTSTTTIDLGAVEGPTTAYGVGSSLALSITGGQGATNLQGGFAGDTIVAKGTGPGLGSNFLWGAGGGDVVTGVAGGAGNDVGTTFLIDSQFESPGGPQQGPAGIDLTITNFHSDTDTVLINPGALALGDIPVFIGTAADYLGALALLAGGGAAQTQAVFQADIGGTWVDADNNGLLNSLDILWFNLPGFASPGYQPGSTNFGNLLGLFTGAEVTAYIDSKLNPESDLVVSDTLQPGQFLFGGGPGIGDKLTLDGGNVADGVLIGFESLEFADGKVGTLSVKQWNTFNLVPGAITGPGINTARFLDGFGFVSTGMITVAAIENYDFSALSEGILMSTRAFFGMGNPQGPGTATGTAFDDTFNVTDLELKAGFTIDGGGGDDTINVDAVLTFGNSFTQNPAYPAAGSGQTNAVVLNVENLSLLDGFNTVGFNPGTQFVNVIGGAFNDLIINPQNLDPGWFLDVMGNAGLAFPFENVIQVTGQANNLSLGTIQATGGTVSLNIGTPLPTNPSNTTMTFQQYQLFQSSIFNIFLTGGSTFANTTISFVDSVTGAALLDSSVGNWVFSSADDTFTVSPDDGALKQNINIASGGDDTLVFGTGVFSGDLVGAGADDSVVFLAEPTDIKGVNGGGATGAGVAIFNDTPSSVTMTVEQHNGFGAPFNTTGGTQTITLATSGTATGDGGIEHYVLANGDDTFKVAPDSEAFEQTVDVSSGGVDVIQYGSPFSGNLTGAEGDDTVQFLAGGGDVDIAEVNGGAETGAGTASFGNADITVSMTLEQHNGFEPPFIDTDGTQTIVLTTVGVVIGDAGIENYVVIGDGDYTFVLAKDNDGLVGGSQNLDLVDPDVFDDTVVFGPGTFSGMLANAGKGDLVKFSGGATDISGLNGGKATGAEHLGFNGGDPSATLVDATLTVAQHNAFTQPFLTTAGIQTITLATDGTITGDIGIEQYVLGEDKTNANLFTVGVLGQSVTGRSDDDTVVYSFGGPSGVLLGGTNNAAGDTLILQAANNELATGSGEFENLTFAAAGSSILRMDNAAHTGFTGNILAPGTNDTIILTTAINGSGLANIENYQLISSTGTNFFIFTDSQTGTVSGADNRADNFMATASQVANVSLLYGGAGTNTGNLIITTDAAGLDLATRTKNINLIQLSVGASANVIGANNFGGNQVSVIAAADTIYTMGFGGFQSYQGAVGRDDVTFTMPTGAYQLGPGNDILRSKASGAITAVLMDGGDGFDTLSLTNDDDLSGAMGVSNFEDLQLANNASVTMTATQYNQFTTNSAAPGANTITIVPNAGVGFSGTTFADVENYILNGDAPTHAYKIAGSNQTITDYQTTDILNTADIAGGLENVTLIATAGVRYTVTDKGGGINHTFVLGPGVDSVEFGGGHSGVDINLGEGINTVLVKGALSGTLHGLSIVGTVDQLFLGDTADLTGLTIVDYEILVVVGGATVTMSSEIWDEYVGTNGKSTFQHTVLGTPGGSHIVVLTSTAEGQTTAFTDGFFPIAGYKLASAGDDFFRVNNVSTSASSQVTVDLSGGGSDSIVLNDGPSATLNGQDVRTTLTNFTVGASGDVVQIQLNGASLSSGAFQGIAAADTNIAAGTTTVVYNSGLAMLSSTWSEADARTALESALGAGTVADEQVLTVAAAFAGGTYIMAVQVKSDDTFANANIDLVGALSNTSVNGLTFDNFS